MRSSMIVRLIDVVFILLLGFINVSDIIHKAQIKLPTQMKIGSNTPKGDRPLLLEVEIIPTQRIDEMELRRIKSQLEGIGKEAGAVGTKSQKELSEHYLKYFAKTMPDTSIKLEKESDSLFTSQALETFITGIQETCKARGKKMAIAIIPLPESMIQGTVNVFDICRRRRIEYSFKYFGPRVGQD